MNYTDTWLRFMLTEMQLCAVNFAMLVLVAVHMGRKCYKNFHYFLIAIGVDKNHSFKSQTKLQSVAWV